MKTLKNFFIALLFSLSTAFLVYPEVVFADNLEALINAGSNNFPVLFILAFISSIILAMLVYFIGKIVNRK
ncbi:hypothetical protein SDC9_116737 [bioreactor metagenome]|uniref:Uncharacterized protein n=1 Tax=bioreactor metagenome TaxID=1076179 RepID=A0A645BWL1_9ZZZZ